VPPLSPTMQIRKNNFGNSFGWYLLCCTWRFSLRFRHPTQFFDEDSSDPT